MTKRISLLSMALILAGFLASAQDNTTWQPDTVYVFQPNPERAVERRTYQYNTKGLLIATIAQYNQNDIWETDGQCTYTYDENNNLQTKLHENWGNWPWEKYSKYTYTYDSNNNLLSELVEDNRGDDTWINNRKVIKTYDENNNLLTKLYQSWNQNTHSWSDETLNTYTYDLNKNLLNEFIQISYFDVWSDHSQHTYTYDSNNNRLTELYQTWDKDSGWKDSHLYTYTYYSNNNRKTELYEIYVGSSKEVSESTFTYDTDNNLINQLTQKWHIGNWVNSIQHNYTYDSKNNLQAYVREKWGNNAWINDSQTLWTYDENDNCTLAENFSFAEGDWHPTYTSTYLYYNNMQNSVYYYPAYKVTATYTKVPNPVAIEDFVLSTMLIYPNPTSGLINIKNEEQNIQMISIYNLSGVQVFNTRDTTFDLSHLSAGIYFVQIITNKGVVTKKIVKI